MEREYMMIATQAPPNITVKIIVLTDQYRLFILKAYEEEHQKITRRFQGKFHDCNPTVILICFKLLEAGFGPQVVYIWLTITIAILSL